MDVNTRNIFIAIKTIKLLLTSICYIEQIYENTAHISDLN